jgi:mRNA interferase MazF
VSRSRVVREAVEAHLADDEGRQRVERFVAAYQRCPETDEELAVAHANARAGRGGAVVRRGEVHWLEVEQAGRRPVLVLTADARAPALRRVLVAGLTTAVRGVDTEVAVGADDGVGRDGAVNLLDVRSVPASLLVERVTTLGPERMRAVCDALAFATGC